MVLVRFQKLYLIPLPFYPFYLSKNCMYTYIPIFGLPSHQGHHRALSRVPSAIQEVIVELSILHMPACKLSHFSHVQLCNPMDFSSPYPPVHGISQARILEWVAISFSRGSSWPKDQTHISYISPSLPGGFLPLAPPGKPIFIYGSVYMPVLTSQCIPSPPDLYLNIIFISEITHLFLLIW